MFFQHLDSNSDSPYSWICSWRYDTNIFPESPHIFEAKKKQKKQRFDVSRVQVQLFTLRVPHCTPANPMEFFFNVIKPLYSEEPGGFFCPLYGNTVGAVVTNFGAFLRAELKATVVSEMTAKEYLIWQITSKLHWWVFASTRPAKSPPEACHHFHEDEWYHYTASITH